MLGVAGSHGLQRCVALVNPDGRKAPFGDTQRERPLGVVAAPDRQRAAGVDFFHQSFTQEFTDHIVGGAALQVGRHRPENPPNRNPGMLLQQAKDLFVRRRIAELIENAVKPSAVVLKPVKVANRKAAD